MRRETRLLTLPRPRSDGWRRAPSRRGHHKRLHATNRLLCIHFTAEYMLVDPRARVGDGGARFRLGRVRRLLVRACEERVECARNGEPLAIKCKRWLLSEWGWLAAGRERVVDDLSQQGASDRRPTTAANQDGIAPRGNRAAACTCRAQGSASPRARRKSQARPRMGMHVRSQWQRGRGRRGGRQA